MDYITQESRTFISIFAICRIYSLLVIVMVVKLPFRITFRVVSIGLLRRQCYGCFP